MTFFYNKRRLDDIFSITLTFFLVIASNLHSVSLSNDTSGYRAAFVIPQVIKDDKTYVLVGCESGGKDKGSYCVPGGSSGFWFFRDTNPLDTAAREFCEETLTNMDYKAVREIIAQNDNSRTILQLGGKKIVGYKVLLQEHIVDDIVYNFTTRRAATWFWQYYYREMDHFALVEWDSLMKAVNKAVSEEEKVVVEALVCDNARSECRKESITVRPITVFLCKEYEKNKKS